MLEIKDIEKLGKLARIELSDAEKAKFLKEIDPILGYVTQVNAVVSSIGTDKKVPEHHNITRLDTGVTDTGSNTDVVVKNFPQKESNYLKVKKIL